MKFDVFLDNRYQEMSYDVNVKKEPYCPSRDAEMKATQEVRSAYLTVLKWMYKPKVLFSFFCTKLKLRECPEPVLLNHMKEQQKKQLEMKKADASNDTVFDPFLNEK